MSSESQWWRTVFTGPWAGVQKLVKTAETTREDSEFIAGFLQGCQGGKVLDVPCGTGRLCLELARRGYEVTGVDLSPALLGEGRIIAETEGLSVNLENRDMRDLPWKGEFDAVICFWGSFGYFDDAGNLDFLRAVFRTLKPGGKLILDTHVLETLYPHFGRGGTWQEVGGALVLRDNQFDHRNSISITQLIIVKDGQVHRETTSIRIYTFRELANQLEDVGFIGLESYGSLAREPFDVRSERLYVVANKSPG